MAEFLMQTVKFSFNMYIRLVIGISKFWTSNINLSENWLNLILMHRYIPSTYIPYSRKVWREESMANSVLKRFGEGKFGKQH